LETLSATFSAWGSDSNFGLDGSDFGSFLSLLTMFTLGSSPLDITDVLGKDFNLPFTILASSPSFASANFWADFLSVKDFVLLVPRLFL